MIKKLAWDMFKNTGNIDTFLEFKQIKEIENSNIINQASGIIPEIQKVEQNGYNKNEWNNNF